MNMYLAKVETSSGSQQIKLSAANIQDAKSQLESNTQAAIDRPVHYTIEEQTQTLQPEATSSLLNASGALLGCVVFLVVAEQKLRRYCKDMRGQ
jgi:hypothetical protein